MLLCEDIAEQKMLFGSQLSDEQEKDLLKFLFNNNDVFAWSVNDLCGVNKDVIEHSLNIDPTVRPKKQKLRKMSDDKAEGARNEVKKASQCRSGQRSNIPRMASQHCYGKEGQWKVENVY
jgi:hypothetical protein